MTCLTSQMAHSKRIRGPEICSVFVPGTEYTIISAQYFQTRGGKTRLLVEFRPTSYLLPHNLYYAFKPEVNFLTDQEIAYIKNKTRTICSSYLGLIRAGDPNFLLYWE